MTRYKGEDKKRGHSDKEHKFHLRNVHTSHAYTDTLIEPKINYD